MSSSINFGVDIREFQFLIRYSKTSGNSNSGYRNSGFQFLIRYSKTLLKPSILLESLPFQFLIRYSKTNYCPWNGALFFYSFNSSLGILKLWPLGCIPPHETEFQFLIRYSKTWRRWWYHSLPLCVSIPH